MDKEERKAAEAERLTEDLSDYLDGVSEEDFDPAAVERWLAAAEELDGTEDSFDAGAAEAAFRARHADLFPRPVSSPEVRRNLHPRRFLPRLAGVAAAAVLVVALAAQGLGVDLFRHAVSWTRGSLPSPPGREICRRGHFILTGRRRWMPMTSGCPCCPPGIPPWKGMTSQGWT